MRRLVQVGRGVGLWTVTRLTVAVDGKSSPRPVVSSVAFSATCRAEVLAMGSGWLALRRDVMAQANGTNSRYSNELRQRIVQEARRFRASGWSWRRIGRALGGVSHMSLRCWCAAYDGPSDTEPDAFVQVAVVEDSSRPSC